MSRKIQLHVSSPCHENWDTMTPSEKGSFCNACQKTVIDFSDMSDRQIAEFFKKPSTGSVCGRFMRNQLDRDIELPKKHIPWARYFFQFTLPAFLLSLKTSAQAGPTGEKKLRELSEVVLLSYIIPTRKDVNIAEPQPIFRTNKWKDSVTRQYRRWSEPKISDMVKPVPSIIGIEQWLLTGQVVDENQLPIPYAAVRLKDTNIVTTTDTAGRFSFKLQPGWRSIDLIIVCVGFKMVGLKVDNKNNSMNVTLPVTPLDVLVLGDVSYSRPARKKPKTKAIKQLIQSSDTTSNSLEVSPSPVPAGSELQVSWKMKEAGNYLIQVFNLDGQLVHSIQVSIQANDPMLKFKMPVITAGTYLLQVSNKQLKVKETEKIIVQ